MPRATYPSSTAPRPTPRAAGFSFIEVLFAVMILGVGFIMTAAIFPVAIQQAKTSSDETVSTAVAWNAFNLIQETLGDEELPPMGWFDNPGLVRSFRDPQAPGTPGLGVNADPDKYIVNGGGRL